MDALLRILAFQLAKTGLGRKFALIPQDFPLNQTRTYVRALIARVLRTKPLQKLFRVFRFLKGNPHLQWRTVFTLDCQNMIKLAALNTAGVQQYERLRVFHRAGTRDTYLNAFKCDKIIQVLNAYKASAKACVTMFNSLRSCVP